MMEVILITGSHPTAFRLSPEKAEQIWSVAGGYHGGKFHLRLFELHDAGIFRR